MYEWPVRTPVSTRRRLALLAGCSLALFGDSRPALGAGLPKTAELDLGGGVKLALALVPPGTFEQGSAPSEQGRGPEEGRRMVTMTGAYYLGKFPVRLAEFRRFVEAARYQPESERTGGVGWDGKKLVQSATFSWKAPGFPQDDEHPVTLVTFADALAFAEWASRATGFEVTLPTEAEWEYAARAGAQTRFWWGEDDARASQYAWVKGDGAGTHPVGRKRENAFGLHDLTGHVGQWCRDWFTPIDSTPASNPLSDVGKAWEHSDEPRRVVRGGSWALDVVRQRLAYRGRAVPLLPSAEVGFRVAVRPRQAQQAAAAEPEVEVEAPPPPPTNWWVLAIPAAGLAVGGALWVASKRARLAPSGRTAATTRGGTHGGRKTLPTRIVADGFYVEGIPAELDGALVSWRARVGARPKAGTVVLEAHAAEGVFVHTDGRPDQVVVFAGGPIDDEVDFGSLPKPTRIKGTVQSTSSSRADEKVPSTVVLCQKSSPPLVSELVAAGRRYGLDLDPITTSPDGPMELRVVNAAPLTLLAMWIDGPSTDVGLAAEGPTAAAPRQRSAATAHVVVTATGVPSDERARDLRLAELTAAVSDATQGVAVLGVHQAVLHDARGYSEAVSRAAARGELTPELAVDVTASADPQGRACLTTRGMRAYGRDEVQVVCAADEADSAAALAFLHEVVDELLGSLEPSFQPGARVVRRLREAVVSHEPPPGGGPTTWRFERLGARPPPPPRARG